MRIAVCVKYVPDIGPERRFTADQRVDRAAGRLSELDEYAAEQALRIADTTPDTQVTYLTIGPAPAVEVLRKALAMGGDDAVHVCDEAIAGSDAPATALVLSTAIRQLSPDLVICGMASTDGGTSLVPAMTAELLAWPQLTFAAQLAVTGDTVHIHRESPQETQQWKGKLPALVSVTDRSGEPRYPSFKGIMAAKRKPLQTWGLADLGLRADEVGPAAARTVVDSIELRPTRSAGTAIRDEGTGGRQLAGYLAASRFV